MISELKASLENAPIASDKEEKKQRNKMQIKQLESYLDKLAEYNRRSRGVCQIQFFFHKKQRADKYVTNPFRQENLYYRRKTIMFVQWGNIWSGQVYGILERKVDMLQKALPILLQDVRDVLSDVYVSAQNHKDVP